MNKCLNCQNDTKNPKFCCRSCSAIYVNKTVPKRKRKAVYPACQFCGKQITKRNRKHCSQKCNSLHGQQLRFDNIVKSGIIHPKGVYRSSYIAKSFMTKHQGHKCAICGISEWNNKPLMLVLDHINGIPDDWRIENLRLICSNCDSQLPTYKSKNKAGGRPYRKW